MTTPNNVLDLIEAFRSSKTMFSAVELGASTASVPPIGMYGRRVRSTSPRRSLFESGVPQDWRADGCDPGGKVSAVYFRR
jgi:hypothetical protein